MTVVYALRLADLSWLRLRLQPPEVVRACSRCGETVGILPAGQQDLHADPAAIIVCSRCITADEKQRASARTYELGAAFRRMWWNLQR
jgi:hypothetical protein